MTTDPTIGNYRRKPQLPYCGLTIVVSNPSRFDVKSRTLLSGFAGDIVQKSLGGVLLQSCDIQCAVSPYFKDNDSKWLPGTKVVLLLGSTAVDALWTGDRTLTLNQLRGCPWSNEAGINFVASYFPQDCIDFKAMYEKDNNDSFYGDDDTTESKVSKSDLDEKSTKGSTSRTNFRFWLEQDCGKATRLLQAAKRGVDLQQLREPLPDYQIFNPIEQLLEIIYRPSNKSVVLDIENDMALNMTVFSLSFNDEPTVYVIPWKRYHGGLAYGDNLLHCKLLRALVWMFSHCEVIVHNGNHDLVVLSHRYRIPLPRKIYDTMLAQSRLCPGTEKSLGHCISMYTYEPYHKNEGEFDPTDDEHELNLWRYNGKDVWTTKLVWQAQLKLAEKLRAVNSIKQVNNSFYAYLLMSLTGIAYDRDGMDKQIAINDRRMTQLLRVLKVLVGHDFLPTSNVQCTKYFHGEMGLKVIKRGKPTEKNPLGNPSLDEKSLYKLYIANDLPTIPLLALNVSAPANLYAVVVRGLHR